MAFLQKANDQDKLGESHQFYQQVIVPQFLLFVFLIVLGAFGVSWFGGFGLTIVPNSAAYLLLRVVLIAYLLGINFFFKNSNSEFTLNFLKWEFTFLAILLAACSYFLHLHPIPAVFLPLSCALLFLTFLRLNISQFFSTLVMPVLVLIVYSYLYMRSFGAAIFAIQGFLFISISVLVNLFSYFVRLIGLRNNDIVSYIEETTEPKELEAQKESVSTIGLTDYNQLLSRLIEGYLHEFKLKLLPLQFIVSIFAFALGLKNQNTPTDYFVWILFFAAIQLMPLFYKSRAQLGYLFTIFTCSYICTLLFSALLPLVYDLMTVRETAVLFMLIGLSSLNLHWPIHFSFIVNIVSVLGILFFMTFAFSPVIGTITASLYVIFHLHLNARQYVQVTSKYLFSIVETVMRRRRSPDDVLALYAWCVGRVSDGDGVLVVNRGEGNYIVTKTVRRESGFDPSYAKALVSHAREQVVEKGVNHGVLNDEILKGSFASACIYWFGYVPKSLFFSRIDYDLDGRSQSTYVFAPATYAIRLIGYTEFHRLLSPFMNLTKNLCEKVGATKLQSQVIVSSRQQNASRKEEISQLIHLVNNAAQDASIVCDTCKVEVEKLRKIMDESEQSEIKDSLAILLRQLTYMEEAFRDLSAGVSDVQWLRELSSLGEVHGVEIVDLGLVTDDLIKFAEFRASRQHLIFDVENREKSYELCARAVSREFLAAILRLITKNIVRRLQPNEKFSFSISESEKEIVLAFSDNGERVTSLRDFFCYYDKWLNGLRIIENFATLSSGQISFESKQQSGDNVFELRLPREQKEQVDYSTIKDGWLLLVDDKVEIVNFYERIADALQLHHQSATNLKQAREIIDSKGEPLLVVTDIQLEGENGLDLVRELRDNFGENLPIIIVSGNMEDGVRHDVMQLGVTKLLTKPVGKKKLFMEIKDMLKDIQNV